MKNKQRPRSGSQPSRPTTAASRGPMAKEAREPQRNERKPKPAASATSPIFMAARTGDRPQEKVPVILETSGEAGYRLLDSGCGLKLEQYGSIRVVRPEAQALWPQKLEEREWAAADAVFTGDTDEEGLGRWHFPHAAMGETWPMQLMGVDFFGRLTSFRHVGVFPEQIVHWQWMDQEIRRRQNRPKVLNLFGYTGVASLIAAAAGAEVTHVDASKKAIGWGKENQGLARLTDRPVRWILDDAMKFIERELRRGNHYDIILTDPPKFGRGPEGEVWQLFDHLPKMLDICRDLLSPQPIGLVLTAYSIRASFYSIHELMMETMRGKGGLIESGELIIREMPAAAETGRALSTSLFSRWTRP
ncbi:class I SAM-dependent methyltransferase [Rhizobium alvei]|uniref:class I SAM-dependent methyltransferase n=1 Tax=Rhizobium alvei TaxID=1132659 RepID=UPI0033927FD4